MTRRRSLEDERGIGSLFASPGAGWDACPFADQIRDPTMRERAVIVVSRAARAATLSGRDSDLAHGARLVTAVATLRMAVTPAGSEDEFGLKSNFLRDRPELADPHRRGRLALLFETALEAEADRRRLEGLGIAGPGHRFAMGQPTIRSVPTEAPASARRRNMAAWRLDAGFEGTLQLAKTLLRDMGDGARRGLSTEDARRALADLAFALCLGTAASADDADLRIGLLGILHDGQREGDPSREVIRTGMALERDQWSGTVAGSA